MPGVADTLDNHSRCDGARDSAQCCMHLIATNTSLIHYSRHSISLSHLGTNQAQQGVNEEALLGIKDICPRLLCETPCIPILTLADLHALFKSEGKNNMQ